MEMEEIVVEAEPEEGLSKNLKKNHGNQNQSNHKHHKEEIQKKW